MTGVNPTFSNSITGTKLMGEVRDLKGIAGKLNKESDALQEILSTANKKLAELNLGLDVWCNYRHQLLCEAGRHAWMLGYTKVHDGGWCIAVKEIEIREEEEGSWDTECEEEPISLLKAPRSVRIAAAEALSDLIDALKAEAESGVRAIEKAREIADKL